ncbi:Transmembrane protein 218 [Amphibalanus amphitrite]|uniref:Transmembrane protein 218 n=1 Tax=Amphibalanus amphitrite TaxID=1232801 RepID=A0A6A4WY80_AMPAM|nr:Transmembrane protein 218 [Amphibalanus amphitrite]
MIKYKLTKMTTVLGLGPGLFTLVLLWSLVILVCLVFMRARRTLALSSVAAAAIFTFLLSRMPIKAADHVDTDDGRIVDPLYVWRLVLVVLLFLAAAGGGAAVLLLHFNERVLAKPLLRFVPT